MVAPRPSAAVEIHASRRLGRPRGARNKKKGADAEDNSKKTGGWILKEKKKLVEGLKKHSPDDIESLASYVPHKTAKEVEKYLEKQKFYMKMTNSVQINAPIEKWSTLLGDLMTTEDEDYSANLSKVMSVIANLEDHPKPTTTVPDYAAIYRCMSAVLQGTELPELGSLECAVILDLLHSLVDTLRSHDTEKQRQIMTWKYTLLKGKVDYRDTQKDVERCRKAIENDFSDFIKQAPSTSTSNQASTSSAPTHSVNQAGTSSSSDTTVANDSIENQKKTDQLEKVGLIPSPEKHQIRGVISDGQNMEATISNDSGNSGSNGSQINSVDPCVQDTGLNNSGVQGTGPGQSANQSNASQSNLPDTQKAGPSTEIVKPKRRGRKKLVEFVERIPKKPKMYNLNPFHIPVQHLKFKKKPVYKPPVSIPPTVAPPVSIPSTAATPCGQSVSKAATEETHNKQSESRPAKPTEPAKVSSYSRNSSNLSGIVPGTPGGSTHHTTVAMVESPYTGPQPVRKLRTYKPIVSKKMEVVIVTPGNAEPVDSNSLMDNPVLQNFIQSSDIVIESEEQQDDQGQEAVIQDQEVTTQYQENQDFQSQKVIRQDQQVVEQNQRNEEFQLSQVIVVGQGRDVLEGSFEEGQEIVEGSFEQGQEVVKGSFVRGQEVVKGSFVRGQEVIKGSFVRGQEVVKGSFVRGQEGSFVRGQEVIKASFEPSDDECGQVRIPVIVTVETENGPQEKEITATMEIKKESPKRKINKTESPEDNKTKVKKVKTKS